MEADKTALTTSKKINNSAWKKKRIMELLNLYPNKFATKLKYNDWTDEEVKKLKKERIIE